MSGLRMTSVRPLVVRYGSFAFVWALAGAWWFLLLSRGAEIPKGFVWPVSIIALLLPGLLIVFEQWAWSWKWVRTLLHVPDLRGTWAGALHSSYVHPETGEPDGERKGFFVIHQTRSTLLLRQITGESESMTMSASLVTEPDGRHTIWGVYRNEPRIELRKRSPAHRGAIQLAVIGTEEDGLEGEYWTDRDTHGSMKFTLVSREQARDLASAQVLTAASGTGSTAARDGVGSL